jgi:hypothetical protein
MAGLTEGVAIESIIRYQSNLALSPAQAGLVFDCAVGVL